MRIAPVEDAEAGTRVASDARVGLVHRSATVDVAVSPHRLDHVCIAAKFPPQGGHNGIHDIAPGIETQPPDITDQVVTRDGLIAALHHIGDDIKLGSRQRHKLAVCSR
jgi:hypothetical protein